MNEIYNYTRYFFIYTPSQSMERRNIVLYSQSWIQGVARRWREGGIPLRAMKCTLPLSPIWKMEILCFEWSQSAIPPPWSHRWPTLKKVSEFNTVFSYNNLNITFFSSHGDFSVLFLKNSLTNCCYCLFLSIHLLASVWLYVNWKEIIFISWDRKDDQFKLLSNSWLIHLFIYVFIQL